MLPFIITFNKYSFYSVKSMQWCARCMRYARANSWHKRDGGGTQACASHAYRASSINNIVSLSRFYDSTRTVDSDIYCSSSAFTRLSSRAPLTVIRWAEKNERYVFSSSSLSPSPCPRRELRWKKVIIFLNTRV